MPFQSKKFQIESKKLEKQEKKEAAKAEKQKQLEQEQKEREEKQKEQDEKERAEREKEEKKARKLAKKQQAQEKRAQEEKLSNRRKNFGLVKKTEGPKEVTDEGVMESRFGYTVHREELSSSNYYRYYRGKSKEVENMVVEMILLEKFPQSKHKTLLEESMRIFRFVGSQGEGGEAQTPYFPRVYEIFHAKSKVYIFLEELPKLTLAKRVKSGHIPEDFLKKWSREILEAVNYLHGIGCAHRNIRPENIIIQSGNDIKVIGFEFACYYWDSDSEQIIPQKKENEKSNYTAPEMMSDGYDASLVDVWMFGVVLCIMVGRDYPFDKKSKISHHEQWEKFKPKVEANQEIIQILDQLFQEPTSRPKAEDLLKNQYLKS